MVWKQTDIQIVEPGLGIGETQDAGKNKMVMAGFMGKIRLEHKSEED